MKKILLSIAMVLFVGGAIALGGTGAFFSDTETSSGNTFSAGAIDLKIDNESYVTNNAGVLVASPETSWAISDLTDELFFDFDDLKPGDVGEDTISIHVTDNDSYVCMAIDVSATPENSLIDPEVEAGDLGPANGNNGELQTYLDFIFWADDGDNVFETGESVMQTLSGAPAATWDGSWHAIADSESAPLEGATTAYVGKAWCFGDLTPNSTAQDGLGKTVGLTNGPLVRGTGFSCTGADNSDQNEAQTDGIVAGVSFYAVQSRNNSEFLCSDLPDFVSGDDEEGGEEDPPLEARVGASLGQYSPSPCTVTVSGSASIQDAIDSASVSDVVCVDPTYNGTGDVGPAIRISVDGVKLAATTQGVNLFNPVVLDNDGTTVTGFTGFVGQAESPSEVAAFYIDGDADNTTVSFNTVTGGENGVLTETSSTLTGGLIQHNVFTGLTRGIFLNPSRNMIVEYNDFMSNTVGVANDEPHNNIIRQSIFNGNSESVGYLDEANGGIVSNGVLEVVLNNIYNGGVNNYSVATVLDGTNNWWGGNGSADQVNISGPNTAGVTIVPEAVIMHPEN